MSNLKKVNFPISYLFHHEHINYFTETSLRTLMQLNGFIEEEIIAEFDRYTNMLGVYKYCGDRKELQMLDCTGANDIEKYFERQEKHELKQKDIIKELVEAKEPIIIWGCGALLQRLWTVTNLKKNLKIENRNIHPPKYIKDNSLTGKILVVNAKAHESIMQDIEQMEISNEVIVL